jgi:hypothetical protein
MVMTDANSSQVALQNLREFQEMSYSDVYALIRQKRFEEAKAKYQAVLENMGVEDFSAAISLNITTPHDILLECMSEMASKVSEPEKIRAVSFDLSAHVIYHDNDGQLNQGIEVSLYSEDVYDFINSSDEAIRMQCEAPASEWQGAFLDIESCALDGLGGLAQQFADHAQQHHNLQGIIENENGSAIVDPMAIARHVAKLLLAIEYHRYMAEFVAEVEVPSEMVFIIGEHDEIEVPIVFYRIGQDQPSIEPEISTALTNDQPHVLTTEETPSIYQDEVPEPALDESMQVNALNTEPMVQADEQILENLEEAGLEASQEKVSLDATEHAEEETVSVGKASLGIAPQPKTFGQLSNKLFSLDEEEASNAEKSA